MKVNGEAIYGTKASPFPQQLAWGRATMKITRCGGTLYLHVFHWPKDGKLKVPGLGGRVGLAWLLADQDCKPLRTAALADGGLMIEVPPTAPDAISSTVAVQALDASHGRLPAPQPQEKPTKKKSE